jgi:cobalt-zinc-cadmium efflux system protein
MAHDHHHHNESGKNLKIAFFLNFGFTIFEIIGGFYVNSVAIISDSVHDLGDTLSLGTAWYLDGKSKKGATSKFSFGYARLSLLGALINSIVLIIGSVFVVYSAINRLIYPEHSDANGMLFIAIIGILVNGYAAYKMSGGKSLNEKVVSWHLMEDVLGWVAVLIVAIVLQFKDIQYLDPLLSLLITIYILWGVFKRLKETLMVFLQAVPDEINLKEIEASILNIDKVKSIHETHIWSLEGEHHVFSTHVILEPMTSIENIDAIKAQIRTLIGVHHFEHITIETELNEECLDDSVTIS